MSDFTSWLTMVGGGVFGLLVWAVGLFLAWRAWQWLRARAAGLTEIELWPSGDPTRLVLASLVLRGGLFRQSILRELRHPFRARAPEPGLDMQLIETVCEDLERSERVLQWVMVVLALLLLTPIWLPAGLALIGVCVFASWRARFQLARDFSRASYDRAALRARYQLEERIPKADRTPLVVSGTGDPFSGLGQRIEGWSIQVDVDRPMEGKTLSGSLDAATVEQAVVDAIGGLKMPDLELGEIVFSSGVESVHAEGLQKSAYSRPRALVPDSTAALYRHRSTPAARTYRVATFKAWNGELIFTYGFRALRRGNALSFETVQLLMTPVAGPYRAIDRQRRLSFGESILWGLSIWLLTPVQVAGAVAGVMSQLSLLVSEMLGGIEARERREIDLNPAYNYGARWSLRTTVADAAFQAWFQKADIAQISQAMNEQALNALIDVLTDNGVDVSRLVAQANVIQTTNVQITSGGSVTMSGAAIGAGAAATVASGAMASAARLAGQAAKGTA